MPLSSFFRKDNQTRSIYREQKRPFHNRGLWLEPLEDRCMPAFLLRLEQPGFEPLTIADGGLGDSNATPGVISYIGEYGTFTLNIVTPISKPHIGGIDSGLIEFQTLNIASPSGGMLTITAADTDFTVPVVGSNPLTLTSQIGGNVAASSGGSITFQSWVNTNNLSPLAELSTSIPSGSITPGLLGPFEFGSFSGSASTNFERGTDPYSIFVQANISLTGAGQIGFNGFTGVTGSSVPAIDLVKLTNGTDNNSPTGPVLPVGSTATFTYIVRNTGSVPLSDVIVIDDNGTPDNPDDDFTPIFIGGDSNGNNLLDLTETWTYTASRVVTDGQHVNLAKVTGRAPTNTTVTDTDVDHHFGYIPASLGDFVWEDKNANGIQDTDEPGLSGFTVNLINSSNAVVASTTTDANGFYLFEGLTPGIYSVQFVAPTGYIPSPNTAQSNI